MTSVALRKESEDKLKHRAQASSRVAYRDTLESNMFKDLVSSLEAFLPAKVVLDEHKERQTPTSTDDEDDDEYVKPTKYEITKEKQTKYDITKEKLTKEKPTKGKRTRYDITKEKTTKHDMTKDKPTKHDITKDKPTKGKRTRYDITKKKSTKEKPIKYYITKEKPNKDKTTKYEMTKENSLKTKPTKYEPTKDESTKYEPIKEKQNKDKTTKYEMTKENSLKDKPTKYEPTKDESTKYEPIKEKPNKDKITKYEMTKENPFKEKPTKYEPIKEKPTKDKPYKCKPTKAESTKAKPIMYYPYTSTSMPLPPPYWSIFFDVTEDLKQDEVVETRDIKQERAEVQQQEEKDVEIIDIKQENDEIDEQYEEDMVEVVIIKRDEDMLAEADERHQNDEEVNPLTELPKDEDEAEDEKNIDITCKSYDIETNVNEAEIVYIEYEDDCEKVEKDGVAVKEKKRIKMENEVVVTGREEWNRSSDLPIAIVAPQDVSTDSVRAWNHDLIDSEDDTDEEDGQLTPPDADVQIRHHYQVASILTNSDHSQSGLDNFYGDAQTFLAGTKRKRDDEADSEQNKRTNVQSDEAEPLLSPSSEPPTANTDVADAAYDEYYGDGHAPMTPPENPVNHHQNAAQYIGPHVAWGYYPNYNPNEAGPSGYVPMHQPQGYVQVHQPQVHVQVQRPEGYVIHQSGDDYVSGYYSPGYGANVGPAMTPYVYDEQVMAQMYSHYYPYTYNTNN